MKFSAAILALGVVPACSLSYLETLTGTAPAISAPAPAVEPPFFFTNGAADEPADDSPSFFFTNGSSDEPAAATTGSYLENLGGSSAAPTGGSAGAASYLDALATPASAAPTGGGITGYLDALPQGAAQTSGAGIDSYAASLNQAAASAPVAAAPVAAAPVAAAAVAASSAPVATGTYLEALAATASSAPTGAGIMGYLDALPRTSTVAGGAGIRAFTDNLPVTNTFAGAGMSSYADNMSGKSVAKAPFSASSSTPAFQMGSLTGKFDFTIVADADMVEQLMAAGGRRVRLTGKINAVN